MFCPKIQSVLFAAILLGGAARLAAADSDQPQSLVTVLDSLRSASAGDEQIVRLLGPATANATDLRQRTTALLSGQARQGVLLSFRPVLLSQVSQPPTTRPTFDVRDLVIDVTPQIINSDRVIALDGDSVHLNRVPWVAATTQPSVAEMLADTNLRPVRLHLADDLQQQFELHWVFDSQGQNAAYLGVGVEAPDETLRAQLNLPEGAGLVVNYVDENGPSKNNVHKHDVLQKLDGQILVNAEQLVTLIHMHKPGDTVTLTLLRRASPITESISLGRKPTDANTQSAGQADVASLDRLVGELKGGSARMGLGGISAGDADSRPITFNDGEILACLDGHGNLLAIEVKTGNVLFRGPVGTPQQWNDVPQAIRDKLSSWRELIASRQGTTEPAGQTTSPRSR